MTKTGPHHLSGKFILRGQAVGFSVLLALMWSVEAARVPHVLFGEAPDFNWPRVLIRSAIVLFIWLIVHVTTRRLLQRLHELEEFLLICSWCRRVGHEDQWLHLEQFFDSRFSTATSHGICPDCARQFMTSGAAASPRCDAVRPSPPPEAAASKRPT